MRAIVADLLVAFSAGGDGVRKSPEIPAQICLLLSFFLLSAVPHLIAGAMRTAKVNSR
jgi:hypothetical protein